MTYLVRYLTRDDRTVEIRVTVKNVYRLAKAVYKSVGYKVHILSKTEVA